jgi:hypothetical protein
MRQASEYQKQLDAFVRHGSINSIPFVKLLEAETLSLRPNLHEPTAKAYRDAVGAVARCGFRLCKGLACEKAGQYMLEQGEKAVSSDYLTEAWNEFLEYGAVAKLTRMETQYGHICDFGGDSSVLVSGPSSLTKPHTIRLLSFLKLKPCRCVNLHEPTAKAYRDAVGAAARCGFRLCKGLACEKAGQYMLEQGEKAVTSDYLTEAWNEFSEYGAGAKLTHMETKWRNLCSHRSAIAKAENVLQVGTTSRLGETRFRSIA